MFNERLTAPPQEIYSLHRKLSGAFLMCSKIGGRVSCRDDFIEVLRKTNQHDLAEEILHN